MNNTPTPRTDEIIEQSWRSINFPNSPIPAKFARQLESELAAVTEQRDRLAEALERIKNYQGRFAEEDPESIAAEALQSLNQPTP